mgnify:CR=1 FL=1
MIAQESIKDEYSTKVLDHLGLVAGMCSELGISKIVDNHIPAQSADKILSTGNAVVGLILNGLGFVNKRLYLVSRFFDNKPVDKLLNVSYLKSSHFNDDALGRSLDAIYAFGVSELFALVSSHVVNHLSSNYGLKVTSGQLDNTAFHLHGQAKELLEKEESVLKITQGYSKDHRPDLVQVGLQLIVENQSGIPLLMKVLDGNQEESQSYGQFIDDYTQKLQNTYGLNTIVADSKLYNKENLPKLGGQSGLYWLTRVPNSLKVVKDLIDDINKTGFQTLNNYTGYEYQEMCSIYGEVNQRWLVLKSTDKFIRDLKHLDKKVERSRLSANKASKKLFKQQFETKEEAIEAANLFSKSLIVNELVSMEIIEHYKFSRPGKPKKGAKPDKKHYTITGVIKCSEIKYEVEKEKLGYVILATNQLNTEQMSAEDLLKMYKDQSKVERSFRFLKDPNIVGSSLFVQKPERMMAILMIMTLCLLVYSALEYVTRTLLKKQNLTYKNQIGKQVQNPTMKWIFECFEGIHILHMPDKQRVVLNLKERHRQIINLLGNCYSKYYT